MPAPPPSLLLAGALLAAATPGLAQPRIWTVPGTSGGTYHAVHWDAGTETILATQGHRVVRIDPIRGVHQVVAEKRWDAPHADDQRLGPDLSSLALVSDGALLLGARDIYDQCRENEVYRCAGERGAQVIQTVAGKTHQWTFHGNDRDARNTGLHPCSLAAGPEGTVFVADDANGRVHLLRPWPGGEGIASGYSIEAIAGSGGPNPSRQQARTTFGALQEAGRNDALEFPMEPNSIAVTSDGTVLVADILHSRVFQLVPRSAPPSGAWTLEVAAGTGEWGHGEGCADARETTLGLPTRLVAGMYGQVHCMTSNSLWELTPWSDAEGHRHWRSRSVTGLISELANAPDGNSTAPHPMASFNWPENMAAGPFGGLLFTVPGKGIRYLDLASGGAALADGVRAYREAKAAGDDPGALAILEALARQRDEPKCRVLERPLRFLARQMPFDAPAGTRPRLPTAIHQEIGSFLIDSLQFTFRAALALEAIRADLPGPAQ